MSVQSADREAAKQALHDVQRYLADEIAPMMAADAVETMLKLPAECGAAVIRDWLESQMTAPNRAVTVGSYLYHAVKKLHKMAELKLVDRDAMGRYVAGLSRLIVPMCPERERAELRRQLSRVAEARTMLASPVELLNREVASDEEERALREAARRAGEDAATARAAARPASVRLRALMTRLGDLREVLAKEKPSDETRELAARLVTQAATESRDAGQLAESLAALRGLGIETSVDRRLFRLLGQRLPGWGIDTARDGVELDAAVGQLLRAMDRMVAMASSREEGIERFSEMVYAAIEQFNEGHLAQAVAMFDLADRLVEEKKVDADLARTVVLRAQSSVALGPLRQFASAPPKHGLLRKILRFFPVFHPGSLLERLDGEPKREVRKLMLSLLEVHGPPCRSEVLDRLAGYLSGKIPDRKGFYSRNVVFLLRRIPRRDEDDAAREVELLSEFSLPEQPFMVTKEALGALANVGGPRSEQVLLRRLAEFERAAVTGGNDYTREECEEILDRACAALVRLGTPTAIAAVVTHAGKGDAGLGDRVRRVEALATCDLEEHDDVRRELIAWTRRILPGKVLGIVVGRGTPEIAALVRALSGTATDDVKALFDDIVARFGTHEFAEVAAGALDRFRSTPGPEPDAADAVTGDLDLFGLPGLLQSLADANQRGRLVISERNGHERATITMLDGKIVAAATGRLGGLDAVCHLIERPRPGVFRFERGPVQGAREAEPLEVLPTILEAIRRHDEFQGDRALVPDGVSLMPTGVRPSVPEGETDAELVRAVWREATRGATPATCEAMAAGDAYRVRRLFAHWFEGGALRLRPA